MKKLVSWLVLTVLLCSLLSSAVLAAPTVKPTIEVLKYDTATGQYQAVDSAANGDVLMVRVGLSGTVSSLSALRIKISYDATQVSYSEGSAQAILTSGSPIFNNVIPEATAQGYVMAYWSTNHSVNGESVAFAENISGPVATLLFTCKAQSGTADFTATVEEIYNGKYLIVELAEESAAASVNFSQWEWNDAERRAFEKIVTLTYPDSKADIEAAEAIFANLSGDQKQLLKSVYPELYDAYCTAWNRYYDLARDSAVDAIDAKIAEFMTLYGDELKLTPETVTQSNYQSVLNMYRYYNTLSLQVKARIDSALRERIEKLNEAAKALQVASEDREIADATAQDFINLYKDIWNTPDEAVVADYESLYDTVLEADATYNGLDFANMSPEMKETVDAYGKQLEHYLALIKEAIAADEAASELNKEMAAFTDKWSALLRLNALTVSVSDETALTMMLSDYELLSDAAKGRLSSYKLNGEQLLKLIESLKEKGEENPTPTEPDNNATQPTVPTEGNTEVKTELIVREIPMIVKVMVILMCVAVTTVFVPMIIYAVYKKKKSARKETV